MVRRDVVRGNVTRNPDFREAAEELAEGAGAAGGGVIRREPLEEVVADSGFLFVQNCIGSAVAQHFGRDQRRNAISYNCVGWRGMLSPKLIAQGRVVGVP
jgi:hypothetical protein